MRSTLPLFAAALLIPVPAVADELVPVPMFRSAELSGGGVVTVVPGPAQRVTIVEGSSRFTRIWVDQDRRLRIDACNELCPREYHLRVVIQSPDVPALAVHSGGRINTAGGFAQRQLAVAVNGGGSIDARSVAAESVSAAVNGGGDVLVSPRATLSAAVNGGGHVRYWGHPAVSTAIRGGGNVTAG